VKAVLPVSRCNIGCPPVSRDYFHSGTGVKALGVGREGGLIAGHSRAVHREIRVAVAQLFARRAP
jgi:hypothetical protein